MERYDHLYDVAENAQVRFFGFVTERTRHDFGIVYTNKFYGKPLVICMQTGQSTLLGSEDAVNPEYLKKIFRLDCSDEAEMLSHFFQEHLPSLPFEENQY
ncbi:MULTISPECIES: DUF3055 domain-containing protein [Brevibacillus]|jgi:hypothetical protein|uniref:DUF3055 domain-containing protein n=1 Tax=Brevibacillus borstelensis AK1 TaxID=1300222 RepID=M8E5L6_9BACL|nr:DUF3055 domain-containing protein [Brevibacillus borstelensis]EMT54556.1 hypothetical protein I532_03090 [Brevibacillus borstelensis AK1]KKX54343.1 hypothetical protein X546_15045 [Brevibacillus borstelensis cifa_chp40]MBE5395953.1 DUF3055 domain-containing protein [Brevibacillus borstelensis]MCC0563225.1 DUF3055 domain-containing protein [Brevibacillus borstelensis]MCM3471302.1 DUF3055 domain-containing protein [Brevibacillus borstelensis]